MRLPVPFLSAAILIPLVVPAVAAGPLDKLDRGPKVGERIPHDVTATDHTGARRSFDSLRGERGLILLFNRSLGWCPFCKRQAADWNARFRDFENLGYKVAALTYDSVDTLARFAERQNIGYTLLSDPDSEIIRAFDLLNEQHPPGSFAYGIPHPIIFVIDPGGVIRHRFSEGRYSERPKIDAVLDAVRRGARRSAEG